jgi:hypothetical protein
MNYKYNIQLRQTLAELMLCKHLVLLQINQVSVFLTGTAQHP